MFVLPNIGDGQQYIDFLDGPILSGGNVPCEAQSLASINIYEEAVHLVPDKRCCFLQVVLI